MVDDEAEPRGKQPGSYAVGYGRPPRQTQFQKGASGNPAGKTSGRRNLTTLLSLELNSKVSVHEGGRHKTITKKHALIKQLVARALKGDDRALARTIPLILQLDASSPGQTDEPLTEAERALLAAHAARLLKSISKGGV